MGNLIITEDVVASYSVCQRKSYQIMFLNFVGDEQIYAAYLRERIRDAEEQYFRSKNCLQFSADNLAGKANFIIDATIKIDNLVVKKIHLKKHEAKSSLGDYSYEPLIFSASNNITREDRIKASYIGYVLSKLQGMMPKNASIVLLNRNVRSIRIDNEKHLPITKILKNWLNLKPEIPPVSFIKNCSICPFEKYCVNTAEDEDSISLLGNMPLSVQRKFESKGIFTVKQLSYLYKPRRRSRYWGDRKPRHQYELQALALRTKSIYTTDLIELKKMDLEIYVDIESIPDQRFHYLIGVYIFSEDIQQYYPFWANETAEEESIWMSFLEAVNSYPAAPIIHYGSYEKRVITELADRYDTNADDIIDRLCNVNQYIYGRIYFPSRTNRLKDICNYLGCTWAEKGASGMNSIVWRYNYDKTKKVEFRDKLINYNQEDCTNLKKLKDVVSSICSRNTVLPDVLAANDENQLLSASSSQVVKEFTTIIKSAHGKYEQSKISLKKNKKSKINLGKSIKCKPSVIPRSKIDKSVRVVRGRVCPLHKRKLFKTDLVAEAVIINLVHTTKGLKKTTVRYWGYKGRCPNCSYRFIPPYIKRFGKNAKYGDGLKAWIVYQRLTMRLPFRKITQLLEDSFNIVIASGGIADLFRSVSSVYISTEKNILMSMLKSPKIHADETLVNIHGEIQYVWVFTDGYHVIFRLTPTRDSSIVHKILDKYEGVLVSDFYSGYDTVACTQQKCWVHLIRDINEDLRKNPFDSEFEIFSSNLRVLLIPIFDAVEKYGLKRRNLNKFGSSVEKFYKKNIDGIVYKSSITKKYQKRFSRYRQSLFVFLEKNEIPWNNNMAERALRHLAVQRKISGSFTALGLTEYLILLGIMQTCRFQNKPFLEFLMSGQKDIEKFKGKKNIKGWVMS